MYYTSWAISHFTLPVSISISISINFTPVVTFNLSDVTTNNIVLRLSWSYVKLVPCFDN